MNAFAAGTVPAGLSEHRRAVDDGLVAGEVRLAGEHVHRLGARRSRHEFHREDRRAGACERRQRRAISVGINHRGNDGAGLQCGDILDTRPTNGEENVRAVNGFRTRYDICSSGPIGVIGEARSRSGTRFDPHLGAKSGEFLHRIGRNRNARFVRRFTGDSYRDHVSAQLK